MLESQGQRLTARAAAAQWNRIEPAALDQEPVLFKMRSTVSAGWSHCGK